MKLTSVYSHTGIRVRVFNATFSKISVISWQSNYWWRKLEYLQKTTDLSQLIDKLYHTEIKNVLVRFISC